MKLLKISTVLILVFLCSCSSQNQNSTIECTDAPNLGMYQRQHDDVVLEYFDLLTDSTYLYYYQDNLTRDSCEGNYKFINEKSQKNKKCQIVFDGFTFIDGHLQSSILVEEENDFGTLFCSYGIVSNTAIIYGSPDEDFDRFVLKK